MRVFFSTSIAIAIILVATTYSLAQVPPAAQGSGLPDAYFQRLRQQPNAFSFSNGYIALVQRLQANRARIENAASPAFALAVANLQGGVSVAGTKLIPVITSVSPDLPNPPYSTSVLSEEYFDGPWPTGTMNSFYAAMSYGSLNVRGDVLAWQMLSHPVDWYAGVDYSDATGNPAACHGLCTNSRVGQLITELLDKNRSLDWGQFDNDGPDRRANSGDDDGSVDFVVIVHPGIGGECGGTNNRSIWSHRGQMKYENGVYLTPTPSATPGFGNIQVNDYVIIPALACDGIHANPIGIASHELGHAFDLPDLYDTDNVTVGGVGNWDLMATGAWGGDDKSPQTPTQMSAWAKERLGWLSPIPVTADVADVALDPIASKPMAYKVAGAGSHYYLISNRQLTGNDIHLPKAGVLIEAINPDRLDQAWSSNQVNTDISNLGVQVIEADGGSGLISPITAPNSARYSAGDVFPISSQQANFDANSSPRSPTSFALCGIHQVGDIVHAQLFVSSNVCPASVLSTPNAKSLNGVDTVFRTPLAPGQDQEQHPPVISVEAVQKNPAMYRSRPIVLEGVIENTGKNYFSHLTLSITDQTGRSFPVRIDAPTELPPSPIGVASFGLPKSVSSYLNKSVKVTGSLVSIDVPGQGKLYVLHVTSVSPSSAVR